ncbi:MAG: GvpL/GvpF family gas vesicle protein [Nocardioidaceae bacterium]
MPMVDEARGEVLGDVGCYVYGVVTTGRTRLPEDLTGVDDSAVELVECGELAAVVGEIALDRTSGRRADVMAHSHVLDALAAAGPVVPVQFGSVLPDREAVVEEFLAPNQDQFAELIDALTGRAQFHVRATYHEGAVLQEVVAENPEVAELRRRTRDLPEDAALGDRVRLGELVSAAMSAKREQDSQILFDVVLPHVAAHTVREVGGVDALLDVAFLVDDERREDFEQALEDAAAAMHERVRLQLVGPVAPYDFVGG